MEEEKGEEDEDEEAPWKAMDAVARENGCFLLNGGFFFFFYIDKGGLF